MDSVRSCVRPSGSCSSIPFRPPEYNRPNPRQSDVPPWRSIQDPRRRNDSTSLPELCAGNPLGKRRLAPHSSPVRLQASRNRSECRRPPPVSIPALDRPLPLLLLQPCRPVWSLTEFRGEPSRPLFLLPKQSLGMSC